MKNRSTISLVPKSLRQGKCKPIKRKYPVGQTLAGYPIIYVEEFREQTVQALRSTAQALRSHLTCTHRKTLEKLIEEMNYVSQPENNTNIP